LTMRIHVAGLSDRGISRSRNEDHYCIGQWVEQCALISVTFDCRAEFFRRYGLLAAVADGMGGYAGSAYASRTALEVLQAQFYGETRPGCTRDGFVEDMRHYLSRTQTLLSGALQRKEGFGDAGTTIAGVAMMPPDLLVVFHAGDSRVFRASGGFVRALTVDHTPLGRDLASGRISEQEAATAPASSRLTRSLGVAINCEVELAREQCWAGGDRFLLGTDGWYGAGRGLGRDMIRESLGQEPDIGALVHGLVARSVQVDGRDNSTLVVIGIEDGDYGRE